MYDLFFDDKGNLKKEGKKILFKMGFILLFTIFSIWFNYLFTKRY